MSTEQLFKKSSILKLFLIKDIFRDIYKDRYINIYYNIVIFLYIIEKERTIFKYVYKYILDVRSDICLIQLIGCIYFDLITLRLNDKSMLEYNNEIIDKFLYIISILAKFNINSESMERITNKYLFKIIKYGNTYSVINASLLSLYIKDKYNNIIINYNYHEGLIICLNLSPRWNENVLYFHNKKLLNNFNLKDIFIKVMKYLNDNKNEESCKIMIDLLENNKSNFLVKS